VFLPFAFYFVRSRIALGAFVWRRGLMPPKSHAPRAFSFIDAGASRMRFSAWLFMRSRRSARAQLGGVALALRVLAGALVLAGSCVNAGASSSSAPERHGSFPSASPDGMQVAFASSRGVEIPAGQSPWFYTHIFIMDADGSHVRRLTSGQTADTAPVWTPDGKWIVFGAIDRKSQNTTLDAVHVDGSARHTIMAGEFLPWVRISPGDERVVFTAIHADAPAGIYTIKMDGTNRQLLNTALDRPWDGIFSPDGKQIVFSSWPSSKVGPRPTDIYIADADGSHRRLLATYPDLIQVPSWSRDGHSIAYQTYTGPKGEADVVVLDVAKGTFRRVSRRDRVYLDETPSWTPDGRLLFQSTRSGRFEIYVMDADGGDVRALTN
jgi:Tol biopolymer transport system component